MPDKITMNNVENNDVFLQPGQSFTVKFSPVAGEAVAVASRKLLEPGAVFDIVNPDPFHGHVEGDTLFGGSGPVGPSSSRTLGGIRIEILKPGSTKPLHFLNTEDFVTSSTPSINEAPKNKLLFQVPANLAGPGWQCRFRNISQENSNCRGQIQYPDEEVTLTETRISRRLLNRTFRQLFIALGLQVFANSGVGLVSVNDEIAHLTNGALSTIKFNIPEPIFTDINSIRMDSLSVTADREAKSNLPKVVLSAGFDVNINVGKLELFGINLGALMQIRRIDINLNFVLRSSKGASIPNVIVPDMAGNIILPDITADVRIVGAQLPKADLPLSVDQFCNVSFDKSSSFNLSQVEKLLECLLMKNVFSGVVVRPALSQYLTEGIMGLAERGHIFWELSADSKDYVVQHFRKPGKSKDDLKQQHQDGADQKLDGSAGSGSVSTGAGIRGTTLEGSKSSSTSEALTTVTTFIPLASATSIKAAGSGLGSTANPASVSDPTLANLDKIEHIVVLMMENRSFDHMLGYLMVRGGRSKIDGLTGNESNVNPITGIPVTVEPLRNSIFKFSPHHEHAHVLDQVADGTMAGFLPDFMGRFSNVNPSFGMGFYNEEKLMVYDILARNFVVCDRWFCSHPG
ncbi:MAG: alkaline phosphatase family protein, partial [Candidatus Promineifilaceae bacterium]